MNQPLTVRIGEGEVHVSIGDFTVWTETAQGEERICEEISESELDISVIF
jgi:hypothetical protein